MCPGKETTWKIQPFHITSSGPESDSEGGGEGRCEGGLSEIAELLAEARKAATEVGYVCLCVNVSTLEFSMYVMMTIVCTLWL